jgi:hypothetical protein
LQSAGDTVNDFQKFGIQYVRGGEVFEFKDEDEVALNDFAR